MRRTWLIGSIVCGSASILTWVVTWLETTVFRPNICTLNRMHFEADLMLARLATLVLPPIGLLLAIAARRDHRRLRAFGMTLNLVAVAIVAAFLARWLPMARLPCVRS